MPELRWLGDEDAKRAARRVPYRLLNPVETVGDTNAGNWLIQGDNLEALKALLPFYAGRVKCIFIDPPYNTKSAFEHYDDNLEHSQWLSMMYPRLELLRDLLSDDGSIWVTIDDNEGHYLKVLMDEVFGRSNFVASAIWVKTSSVHNNAEFFSSQNDTIHCYGKNIEALKFGRIPRSTRNLTDYKNLDSDPRGPWASSPLHVSLTSGQRGAQYARTGTSSGLFPIVNPHGEEKLPPNGRAWAYSEETIQQFVREGRIYWGRDGTNEPRYKRFLSELKEGVVPTTVWGYEDVGHNQEAKTEAGQLGDENALFGTPKPERLLQRILQIVTRTNDIVLDSFLGSGTTAAVAHKMKRQWIGVEMGEHARTHCLPRLKKVVEGEQGGISAAAEWKGGGGFRFVTLGEPVFGADGRINPAIRFGTLAAYLWFLETGSPHPMGRFDSPLLGTHNATAIVLLYNGILGDRRPEGGNVLTQAVWKAIVETLPTHSGPRVIYGEACRLSPSRLKSLNVVFRQIPYDIRMR